VTLPLLDPLKLKSLEQYRDYIGYMYMSGVAPKVDGLQTKNDVHRPQSAKNNRWFIRR